MKIYSGAQFPETSHMAMIHTLSDSLHIREISKAGI